MKRNLLLSACFLLASIITAQRAMAETIWEYYVQGSTSTTPESSHIVSFDSATPGTIISDITLTGLAPAALNTAAERLVGIDFRPLDGLLYAIKTNGGLNGNVVTINIVTGAVTSIGGPVSGPNGSFKGFDFNPVADLIRTISDARQSRRYNPNDGTIAGTDTDLTYPLGDVSGDFLPAVSNVAYSNNLSGAATTTLFGIDHDRDTLVRIGGVNGSPSPNLGVVSTIGPLGVDARNFGGFDISGATGVAYAVIRGVSSSNLYSINLTTGAATNLGAIGGNLFFDGLSVQPAVAIPPAITLQPLPQTVCAGSPASFTATASGRPVPTVQWQVSTDGGTIFTDIPGATTTSLVFVTTTAAQNGNLYRAVFSNGTTLATTNAVLLTVNIAPVVTISPVSQTVALGLPVTFTAAATGTPTPAVQWQVSTDGGATFSSIAGATATTLTFTPNAADNNNRYRAVFTNICASVNTNVAVLTVLTDVFQIRYAANLTNGDSVINLTNTGANGASLNGPGFGGAAGNICANVYAFSPDEQLVSCCSCLITPNGLVSLSVNNDMISNTLTGVRPNSIVVKVVNTGAGGTFSGISCTNSAALAGSAAFPLAGGLLAFGTTIHASGTGFPVTETPFSRGTLSPAELASITNRCTNIIGNGSTFGICRSCRAGGLNQQ